MNRKGFTLIELAIVLVIIGIILGAVLKGQDLIRNARAKKLIAQTTKWEAFTWSFMDQKGRFPGDTDHNGIIGNWGEQSDAESAIQEIKNQNYTNPPIDEIVLGNVKFYVRIGNNYNGTSHTPPPGTLNVIALCLSKDCKTKFNKDAIKYAEFVDTSIDGEAKANAGLVRGATSVKTNSGSNHYVVKGVTLDNANADYSTSDVAVVYFFDGAP